MFDFFATNLATNFENHYFCGNYQSPMATSYYLRPTADGKSAIYIVATHRAMRFRRRTGIIIESARWNEKTETVRDLRDYPSPRPLNLRLRDLRSATEEELERVMASGRHPSGDEFWTAVFKRLDGVGDKVDITFTEYMRSFADEKKRTAPTNSAKQYATTYRFLREFERDKRTRIAFQDVTIRFYERFRTYIYNKGYSDNYFGSMIKCMKTAYRTARDRDKLHTLNETSLRGFSAPNVAARTIYLSLEELQKIADVEITPATLLATFPDLASDNNFVHANLARKAEALNVIRNKFLLGAYTALRVSDFNHLRDVHVSGDFFRVTTQKTGAHVVIPIHPVIRRMIDSGFDISTPVTDQKINAHIKEVARMAGITQMVEGTKLIDHRAVVGFYPKCDLITTHTARRSAATNMYKAGIPTISIMRITGHTTEKSFMKYIKITAEENAELMAKNKFFMG